MLWEFCKHFKGSISKSTRQLARSRSLERVRKGRKDHPPCKAAAALTLIHPCLLLALSHCSSSCSVHPPWPQLQDWIQGLELMVRKSPKWSFPSAGCLFLDMEARSGPRSLLDFQHQSRRAKCKWKSRTEGVCAGADGAGQRCLPQVHPGSCCHRAAFQQSAESGLTRSWRSSLFPAGFWDPSPGVSVSPG